MENQLKAVAESYDRAITEHGNKDAVSYENLPAYIKNDPDYPLFQKARTEGGDSGSENAEIKNFLSPAADLKFVDLGCCLNLMLKGYDKWPSLYYGVDISKETISLLKRFAAKQKLSVGALFCGSIHETPFENNYFDIGACVGVLEYFEKDFVEKSIIEACRIIKPDGRFVLDIPDNKNPMRRFMNLVEEAMGRPDRFDLSPSEFEDILEEYFEIEKKENFEAVAMVQYFLRRRF